MSNYSPTTIFADKDGFPTNDPRKIIKGSEFGAEFTAISTMSGTKADLASPVFTGTVTIPTATIATANIAAGAINATSLDLQNNQKIQLGSADQLEIYTDGNNSIIKETGDGALSLRGNEVTIKNPSGTETMAFFTQNQGAVLYYDNSPKIATDTNGVSITGNVDMPNNAKLLLGDNDNLQLHYDGTDSLIEDTASGNLIMRGVQLKLQSYATGNEDYITCTNNGAVALFNNGVQKANTFGFGFQVAGRLEVDTPSTNADETVIFRKDNTVCGGLRTTAGQFPSIAIGSADTGIVFQNSSLSDSIRPWDITGNQSRSGAIDLGASGAFWDDIYALNGTINTSDANEKQSIEELTEAETRVARACKGLVRKFKWNSAVEKKGSEARYHFGVVAQDVQAAFEAEGLDAGDYGLFVSNTEEDENGVEQTRLGVRYTELLAFIIGGLV